MYPFHFFSIFVYTMLFLARANKEFIDKKKDDKGYSTKLVRNNRTGGKGYLCPFVWHVSKNDEKNLVKNVLHVRVRIMSRA